MAYTSDTPWGEKPGNFQRPRAVQTAVSRDRTKPRGPQGFRPKPVAEANTFPFQDTAPAVQRRYSIAFLASDGSKQFFEHITASGVGLEKICANFARGTLIKTPSGAVSVEDLRPGDLVTTKDNGPQALRWIGSCPLRQIKSQTDEALLPIRIKADALGFLRPDQDLVVASHFRLLVNHPNCASLFGSPETLAPATNLLDGDSILRVQTGEDVNFYNLVFDQHQIISANGLETESYHPGNFGISAMSYTLQSHILAIFPHLNGDLNNFGKTVRPILKGFEAEVLKVG